MTRLPVEPEFGALFLKAAARATEHPVTLLWKLLPQETRSRALSDALDGRNGPWLRESLTNLIMKRGGYRASTIRGWSVSQVASACAKMDIDKRGVISAMVSALHLPAREHLQDAFLEGQGLSRESLETESEELPLSSEANVAHAAEALLLLHPSEDALYYLLCLAILWPQRWPGLDSWLVRFAATDPRARRTDEMPVPVPVPAAELVAEIGTPPAAGTAPEGPPSDLLASIELPPQVITSDYADPSPLDEALLLLVVQSKGEIHGAPDLQRVDAILSEFTRLNATRHQSFRLVGYRDALFGRPADRELPASNLNRKRWYYAGLVHGLAREGRTQEIVDLHQSEETVRGLGDSGLGPSRQVAHMIFGALCDVEKYESASGFATVDAMIESMPLLLEVLNRATRLLRQERPADANPMFDRLWQALSSMKSEGVKVDPEVWADVQRRRAHCLRHIDDLGGARLLLDNLLQDETDVNRPAVLVDLGLMDGGLRRLADLHLPVDHGARLTLLQALERGESRFREAESLSDRTRSHALYVLGFRELVQQQYDPAREHLEQAVASFGQRPEVYSGGGLLERARLHLGLALCLSMPSSPDMHRGVRLVEEWLEGGGRIPSSVVEELLIAVDLVAADANAGLVQALLRAGGDGILEATAATSAGRRLGAITDALLVRAHDRHRSLTASARDWLLALPALRQQQRVLDQEEALDALESAAMQGVLLEPVRQLLRNEEEYGPAWSVDDAQWSLARLAESRGEFHEATILLQGVFYRALARGEEQALDWSRDSARDEARQVVERLGDYGAEFRQVHGELNLQLDLRLGEDEAETTLAPARVPVHILFVGGNEIQAQYDREIKQELNARHPHVVVEFMHTGWSSNWNTHLDEFERRVGEIQGVVVSRYMRTLLGRGIRKACATVPWRGCGGTGKTAMMNSILAAADAAQRKAASLHPARPSGAQRAS